jgi:hypothetical protein
MGLLLRSVGILLLLAWAVTLLWGRFDQRASRIEWAEMHWANAKDGAEKPIWIESPLNPLKDIPLDRAEEVTGVKDLFSRRWVWLSRFESPLPFVICFEHASWAVGGGAGGWICDLWFFGDWVELFHFNTWTACG